MSDAAEKPITEADAQALHDQRRETDRDHDRISCWCCCRDCGFQHHMIIIEGAALNDHSQAAVTGDARDVLGQFGCARMPGANEHVAEGTVDVHGQVWRVAVVRAGRSAGPVKARLARALADMAVDGKVRATQGQLAAFLRVNKKYAQTALHDLRDDGIVKLGYRYVDIIDLDALRRAGQATDRRAPLA